MYKKTKNKALLGQIAIFEFELAQDKNYIFQEYKQGDEYTVDVFIDKKGNVISIVPRLRIEVRAGEVNKAKTIKDKDIIDAIIESIKAFLIKTPFLIHDGAPK